MFYLVFYCRMARHIDWQPVRNMIRQVLNELHGLTIDEEEEREEDIAGAGDRVGGVGYVRINNSRDILWTVVACNDLSPRKCWHHDEEMALRKTATSSEFNLEGALFFVCNQPLTDTDMRGCRYNNLYPEYPQQRFIIERDHQADVTLRPV